MAEPIDSFDKALAFALTLPGVERSTSYGQPAAKVAANGRAFVSKGHEPDTAFVVSLDRDEIEILKETGPDTFWQTAHYQGWDAVLVRFDSPDPQRVREVIARSRDYAAARKPARPRKT